MPEFVEFMYHGTRTPKERLYSEGIRPLTLEEVWNMTYEALRHFKVDEIFWRRRSVTGVSSIEMKYMYGGAGRQVWVTEYFRNAAAYARASPEVLAIVIEDILKIKYGYYRLRSEVRTAAMEKRIKAQRLSYLSSRVGTPKVVKLDVKNMGLTGGLNVPVGEWVAPDRIVDVAVLPSKEAALGRLELW